MSICFPSIQCSFWLPCLPTPWRGRLAVGRHDWAIRFPVWPRQIRLSNSCCCLFITEQKEPYWNTAITALHTLTKIWSWLGGELCQNREYYLLRPLFWKHEDAVRGGVYVGDTSLFLFAVTERRQYGAHAKSAVCISGDLLLFGKKLRCSKYIRPSLHNMQKGYQEGNITKKMPLGQKYLPQYSTATGNPYSQPKKIITSLTESPVEDAAYSSWRGSRLARHRQ